MVDERGALSDLPAFLPGQRRGRSGGSAGDRAPLGVPGSARRRYRVDIARLSLAAGRQRIRHLRLPRHRPSLWRHRDLRHARRSRPRPRDAHRHGPGGEPHLRRAPVVHRIRYGPRLRASRLVLLARSAPGSGARHTRRGALELGILLRGACLGVRPGLGPVLPAPVRARAAGPELGESPGSRRRLRHDELVARSRGRRFPGRRDRRHLEAPGAARRGARARSLRRRPRVLRRRPAPTRVPPGDARAHIRPPSRLVHRRGGLERLPRVGPPVLRPRQTRIQHAHPVRARQPRPGKRQVLAAPTGRRRTCRRHVGLAGDPGRAGLECPLPGKPRSAARGVSLRRPARRLVRVGHGTGHRVLPPARNTLHLPGPGDRHARRPLHPPERLPRRRVPQLPERASR